jgi:hypothetical protein
MREEELKGKKSFLKNYIHDMRLLLFYETHCG